MGWRSSIVALKRCEQMLQSSWGLVVSFPLQLSSLCLVLSFPLQLANAASLPRSILQTTDLPLAAEDAVDAALPLS